MKSLHPRFLFPVLFFASFALSGEAPENEPPCMEECGDPAPREELQEYSTKIEVRRAGDTGEWGTSADVAAGKLDSNLHKAEVRISFDPKPMEPVNLSIGISGVPAGGKGESGKAALVLSDGSTLGGSQSVTLRVSPDGLTGTYTSSNKRGDCTLTADGSSATIHQKWDYLTKETADWDHEEGFAYDTPHPVSLTIKLDENTPIVGHPLVFSPTEVSYTKIDPETWEVTDYSGVKEDFSRFIVFSNEGRDTTDSTGKASSSYTVFANPDNDWSIFVYDVKSRCDDSIVFK